MSLIDGSRSKALFLIALALPGLLLGGCTAKPSAQNDRISPALTATDPKTLVLQLGDLPAGSSEGAEYEVTPGNIDLSHDQKKIDDISYAALKDPAFKGLAVKTFLLDGDAQVTSVVIVFQDVAAARRYFSADARGQAISGAPVLGDESYSEEVSTEHQEGNERVITGDSIHNVVRVQNAIAELTLSDQLSHLDKDEALDLARRAAAKLR